MNILRINRKRKKRNRKLNLANRLLLIIILLMMTTLAWFTFSRMLDAYVNLHINSWNVEFFLDGEKKETPLDISLEGLYPGMEDKEINILIKNSGETGADINYTITDITMFGHTYELVDEPLTDSEYYILNSEPTVEGNISTYNLINEEERFPFKIQIENSIEAIPNPEEDETKDGHFIIKATWDGTNDELDRKWGHDAADFYEKAERDGIDPGAIKFNIQINVVGKAREGYEGP